MSGLLFSVGAVATGAGGIARTAGFKELDDTNLDAIYEQFQKKLSPEQFKKIWDDLDNNNKGIPVPVLMAGLITFSSSWMGAFFYMAKHLLKDESQTCNPDGSDADMTDLGHAFLTGLLVGAIAGICFSLGARMAFECSKKCEPQSSRRPRSILPM